MVFNEGVFIWWSDGGTERRFVIMNRKSLLKQQNLRKDLSLMREETMNRMINKWREMKGWVGSLIVGDE